MRLVQVVGRSIDGFAIAAPRHRTEVDFLFA